MSLSHYRVPAKLGQGGLGVIYRAEDTNLPRQVAIEASPDRFAKLPATLNHPNIPAIHRLEKHKAEVSSFWSCS